MFYFLINNYITQIIEVNMADSFYFKGCNISILLKTEILMF